MSMDGRPVGHQAPAPGRVHAHCRSAPGRVYGAGVIRTAVGLILVLLLPWLDCAHAGDEHEDWFNEPEPAAVPQVGRGELLFLSSPPEGRVLESINRLTVDRHSLESGWVDLRQCYRGLDPVSKTGIVYAYHNMRALKVESYHGIAVAQAKTTSIELEGVARGAELCVTAQVQILGHNPDGSYTLRNGPFHRRFLDGYFPMRVTLDVRFPAESLRLVALTPAARPGFEVVREAGRLHVDALFAGSLTVEVMFAPTPNSSSER